MRYVMTLGVVCVLALAWAAAAAPRPTPVAAVQASDAYRVVVPVADTSADNRSVAFATALRTVITHATGRAPPAAVLATASTYVQQYQYQQAPAGAAQPYLLVVMFAPSAVEHLERTLAAPAPVATVGVAAAGSTLAPPASDIDNLVWVAGIHSAMDFADAVAALDDVPGVDSVGVRSAQDDGMLLDVRASVPLSQVLATVAASGHLTTAAHAQAGAAASLRWRR